MSEISAQLERNDPNVPRRGVQLLSWRRSFRITWPQLVLVAAVALTAALRFWGIQRGYPDLYVHDEIYEVNRALQLLRGNYDFTRAGKGFYFYLLSSLYATDGLFAVARGQFSGMAEYVSRSIVVPGRAILISRILTATMGTLSVILVYRLGRRALPSRSWSPALVLAVAWATCGYAVWLSKWGLVETCLVFFALLAAFPMVAISEQRRLRDYVAAALLVAVSTSTKLYGIVLLIPIVTAHLLQPRQGPLGFWYRISDRNLIVAGVFFIVGWSALEPGVPVFLVSKLGLVEPTVATQQAIRFEGETHFGFYLTNLRWMLGNLLSLLVVLGAVFAIRRRNGPLLVVGSFAFAYVTLLLVMPAKANVYARYLLVGVPFMMLVGVYGLIVLCDWIARVDTPLRRLFASGFVPLCVVGYTAWNGLDSLYRTGFYQQYVPIEQQAVAWFHEEVPEGSNIVLNGWGIWPGHQTVPLYATQEYYQSEYEKDISSGRRRKNVEVLQDLASASHVPRRYRLAIVTLFDPWESLEEYLQDGEEYFVIDTKLFVSNQGAASDARQSRLAIYDQLRSASRVALVQRFVGKSLQGDARTIEVYELAEGHPSP